MTEDLYCLDQRRRRPGTGLGVRPGDETIRCCSSRRGLTVLNTPDNITVSPRGGLVLCEDGGGHEYLHGLTVDGEIFKFAQNNVVLNGERNGIVGDFTGSEWAGACYSPDGGGCSRTSRARGSRSPSPVRG